MRLDNSFTFTYWSILLNDLLDLKEKRELVAMPSDIEFENSIFLRLPEPYPSRLTAVVDTHGRRTK